MFFSLVLFFIFIRFVCLVWPNRFFNCFLVILFIYFLKLCALAILGGATKDSEGCSSSIMSKNRVGSTEV